MRNTMLSRKIMVKPLKPVSSLLGLSNTFIEKFIYLQLDLCSRSAELYWSINIRHTSYSTTFSVSMKTFSCGRATRSRFVSKNTMVLFIGTRLLTTNMLPPLQTWVARSTSFINTLACRLLFHWLSVNFSCMTWITCLALVPVVEIGTTWPGREVLFNCEYTCWVDRLAPFVQPGNGDGNTPW